MALYGCSINEVDLGESPSRIVVEGWLIDQDTLQEIRITQSVGFAVQTTPPSVNDALSVKVISNINDSYLFVHTKDGRYQSTRSFSGKHGISYTLEILLSDGRRILSEPQVMKSAPAIDSLTYTSYERISETTDEPEIVYYPVVFTSDNDQSQDYYRWKLYKNDTLFNEPRHIVLLNDRFINGKSYQNEFNSFDYSLGDDIKIELLQISASGYRYLELLKAQTTTIGTVSAVSPGPIPGNLSFENVDEEVLGFWGAASVRTVETNISE